MDVPHTTWGMSLQLRGVPLQGLRGLLSSPVHRFQGCTGFTVLYIPKVSQVLYLSGFHNFLGITALVTGFISLSFHMYICHRFNEFVGFIGFWVIQLWETKVYKLRQSFMLLSSHACVRS